LLRLAISAYIYEYDDLVYIIFVGDDDLIEAYNLVLNLVHCAQLELIGIKIKIDNSKVPTFCNFLITEHGRYVDLVNRAAKLQSKQFRKVEEIAAYQTSVADWLKSIRTQHELEYVAEVTAYKYGLIPQAVKILYSYLKTFTQKDPVELSIKNMNLVVVQSVLEESK